MAVTIEEVSLLADAIREHGSTGDTELDDLFTAVLSLALDRTKDLREAVDMAVRAMEKKTLF